MNIRIVADSSANLFSLPGTDYASVPMKIVTDEKEFVDDGHLDCAAMMDYLDKDKGRSGSSCPNVHDWLEAFGEGENIFTLAISRSMSGSHNSALQAKEVYEEAHPDRKVCCLDTLTAGPEMILIVEKIQELAEKGLSFQELKVQLKAYMNTTHMNFMLSSVKNLAKNGRVNPLIAKAVGILNIHIVGQASDSGTFQQEHKCRGEKKGLGELYRLMKKNGYQGGKVRINHSFNEPAALALKDLILQEYPQADIAVAPTAGLCSYYAEQGGLMVGLEG